MISDSIAAVAASLLGTSSVTAYVESGTGIAAGGKTGLVALTVSIAFFLSIFLLPIFAFIPGAAAAAALIYVGVLMMSPVGGVDFPEVHHALPASSQFR
jgi:AGZA family xanthine/uracil permease-like MFS transporter